MTGRAVVGPKRWNHNIHYHRLVRESLPGGARVLDAGCGEGLLALELSERVRSVTAIDRTTSGWVPASKAWPGWSARADGSW